MIAIRSDRFVTLAEAQQILGISRQTAYRWAWNGTVPAVKVGGRWRLPLKGLQGLFRPDIKDSKEANG